MTSFCKPIKDFFHQYCTKCRLDGKQCRICALVAWFCGSCAVQAAETTDCDRQETTVVVEIIKLPSSRFISWISGGKIKPPCPQDIMLTQMRAVNSVQRVRLQNNPYTIPINHDYLGI